MSSAKTLNLFSSSSFRLALSTFLAVSVTSACFLLLMFWLIKQALIADVMEDLQEASDALLVDVEASDFFHPTLYPKFQNVEVYDDDWDIETQESFIDDYQDFLWELLEDDDITGAERIAISSRLFVLGELDEFDRHLIPFSLVDYLFNEEIPEAFHPWMDELLAEQKNSWPEYPIAQLMPSDLVYFYLDQDEVLDNDHICARLTNADEEVLYSNLDGFQPSSLMLAEGFSAWVNPERMNQPSSLREHRPMACVIRTLNLADGGRLLLGEPIDHSYQALEGISRFLTMGLISIFVMAIGCGYWVSNRAVRKITHINEICDRITQGELGLRIPEDQSSDDYDQLAHYINNTLDRMEVLLNSVKRVSDNIAHDLKTPLTHVHTQLERLLQSPAPSHEEILHILNENERIIQCFNALLRIAEIEQGAQRQAFAVFDFSAIIATLRDLYEPVMEQKQIIFTVDCQIEHPWVYGDKHQWLQTFANLLDNAIKYSPEGGEIRLTLQQIENGQTDRPLWHRTLRVTLKDSGPGIPAAYQDDVFERFYRMGAHRSTPGFGLGLSLVKAVCELHGASIELTNDQGLVVEICLKLEDSDAR